MSGVKSMSLAMLNIILLIIFDIVCFSDSSIFLYGNVFSKLYISYAIFFTIITSFKYIFWGNLFSSNKKNKYLYAIILVFFFIGIEWGIFKNLPKFYSINNWYKTSYSGDSIRQFIDFLFLPRFYINLDIKSMIINESAFSIILGWTWYMKDNLKKGKWAYIFEKIVKFLFRWNMIIVFFLYIFTIPEKYLTVNAFQNAGIALSIGSAIIFILKHYLILKKCSQKNENKYGKENLIITITPNNFRFSLSDHFLNPLRVFYKYDNKNFLKSILVDGKDYTFASYEAIRLELIDITQYSHIAYYIILQGNIDELVNENSEFEQKVNQIIEKNNNFIIYHPKIVYLCLISKVANNLKEKYLHRYTRKKDVKKVLELVKLDSSADKLKDNAKKVLDYVRLKELDNYLKINKQENIEELKRMITGPLKGIEDDEKAEKLYSKISEEKNRYIKYGLNLILESFNYTEYFYTLLKMCEYITHYMALKNIIDNPEKVSKDKVREGTLSAWRECIEYNPQYEKTDNKNENDLISIKDVIDSLVVINNKLRELDGKNKIAEKKRYSFKEDICKCVADIRNKIVAHGVITHETAEGLIEHLFNITYILIKEFEELNISIKDDEKIKHIFENDISALYKKNDDLFLYSNTVIKRDGKAKIDLYKESLNYETGDHQIIDKKVYIHKDYIYSVKDIETMLSKWVEK